MTDALKDLDVRLSAFLDGELSPEEMAKTEAMIAGDEAVAARLEALAAAQSNFDAAAGEIDDVPMSAGLSDLMDNLESGTVSAEESSNVVAFPIWKRAGAFIEKHRAVAAGVVVAAGTMSMTTAIPAQVASVDSVSGTYYADSGFGRVLEASASGTETEFGDGMVATPRLTFISGEQYCRVVDINTSRTDGRLVACRAEDAWRVAIATFGEAASPSQGPYRTASAAGSQSIETFLDTAMSDAPLDTSAEADLIQSGWTKKQAETE
ncbi:hypothetical protein WNY37_14555 [Henriciella sp. AS95]|uniref:hypothetical protein n=1 Tax=Henriciella sp. AS95 TaxID=3135782 RepID=UPI003174492B